MIGKVEVNGAVVPYCTFGSGKRTFVILPGMSTCPVVPMAEAIAQGFSLFTEDYTVYLFDRKEKIDGEYGVRDMARDTAEAMRSLGIRAADIFGASQGGQIAMVLAAEYPELVHALYLASTAARPNATSRSIFKEWMRLTETADSYGINHAVNRTIYSEAFYAANRAGLEAAEHAEVDKKRFYRIVQGSVDFDIYNELPQIGCPVFVTGARQDAVMTLEAPREIAEKLGCELYVYDGYGHAAYDEAPDYRSRMLQKLRSTYAENAEK